jgi:predicted TPR repeat methyltransferase
MLAAAPSPSSPTSSAAMKLHGGGKKTSQEYLSFLALEEAMETLSHVRNMAGGPDCDVSEHIAVVERLLEKSIHLFPENDIAGFKLAALRGEIVKHQACPAVYTRELFDQYADTFEESLVRLHYSLPKRIADLLRGNGNAPLLGNVWSSRLLGASAQKPVMTLDCGCGTGWVGDCLQKVFGKAMELYGVDLSPKMVAHARSKCFQQVPVYRRVACADCIHYLHDEEKKGSRFDLIVAADMAPYIGNLEPFLIAARNCLRKDGLLIFTVESLEQAIFSRNQSRRSFLGAGEIDVSSQSCFFVWTNVTSANTIYIYSCPLSSEMQNRSQDDHQLSQQQEFALLETERFAHSLKYLRKSLVIHGLCEIYQESEPFRDNRGAPLQGHLLVAKINEM